MPTRALRPCLKCGTPCKTGRCDAHPKVDTRPSRQERGLDAQYYALVPKVMERDQWFCQLCYKPIYRQGRPRHPLGPSVDHIIPRSQGGESTMENLRAAHYGCNSARGNRPARAS